MGSKVFVSGCFDMLHSGHVAFLKTAASFGDVYVGVGRDETIKLLKGSPPANTEAERLFMVKSLRYVKDAWLNSGLGVLDFAEDLRCLCPEFFVVNEDGHTSEKAELCKSLGIKYRVLTRQPELGLPVRSSSQFRRNLPYRVEICGGWLDQPYINQVHPGWVICAQLAPRPAFAGVGGGLASSTRACMATLGASKLTEMEPEALALLAFRYENGIDQPDHPVTGAQDALGICIPGISFQYYDGGYWPAEVQSITDIETLRWLESHLSLYSLRCRRPIGFDPMRGHQLDSAAIKLLAQASALCKNAIASHNLTNLSESFALCRQAQKILFPAMFSPRVLSEIEQLEAGKRFRNWKFTGAGGGGWVILLDAEGMEGSLPLKISV